MLLFVSFKVNWFLSFARSIIVWARRHRRRRHTTFRPHQARWRRRRPRRTRPSSPPHSAEPPPRSAIVASCNRANTAAATTSRRRRQLANKRRSGVRARDDALQRKIVRSLRCCSRTCQQQHTHRQATDIAFTHCAHVIFLHLRSFARSLAYHQHQHTNATHRRAQIVVDVRVARSSLLSPKSSRSNRIIRFQTWPPSTSTTLIPT
jgi:hypothetical protein